MRALLSNKATVLAVVAAIVAIIVGLSGGSGGSSPPPSVVVPSVNGPSVIVPEKTLKVVQQTEAGHHEDLRTEKMVTPQDRKANAKQASPLTPAVRGPPPLASPQQAGCLTRQLPTNFSNRKGVRPLLIVLHYTVSRNVVGWSDANAIFAFFSISAVQASSNYVNDNEAHCIYMVPESQKAWAQAGFNSYTACSFEVVNTGFEATYVGPFGGPGERQLAREVHDCAIRWHIPIRQGHTSGCRVTVPGVVDHKSLGQCGGGHQDIGKFSVTRIITAASQVGAPVLLPSKLAQAVCNDLVAFRLRRIAHKPITAAGQRTYDRRTRRIRRGGWFCFRQGKSPVGLIQRRHA